MNLAELLEPVRTDLDALEEYLTGEMRPSEQFLHEYLEHVARFRGKRLRPALVFLAARACGDVNSDHLRLARSPGRWALAPPSPAETPRRVWCPAPRRWSFSVRSPR